MVAFKCIPVSDDHLKVIGAAIIIRNITEESENMIAFNRITERLKLATESGGIGIWDWNIARNELVWDDQMYKLYGLASGGFSGAYEAWLNGLHPDDRDKENRISLMARKGEGEYDTEFRIVWKDGSIRWLKAKGIVIRDGSEPVRMIGVNYDITLKKEADAEIAQLKRLYATLSQVNQTIVRIREPKRLYQSICDVALEYGEFRIVWIASVSEESGVVTPAVISGISMADWPFPPVNFRSGPGQFTETASAIQSDSVTIVEDVQQTESVRSILKNSGLGDLRTLAIVPIHVQGKVCALLNLISTEAGFFRRPAEVKLLEEMGIDISFALDQIEKDKLLRQWADAFENCAHGIGIALPESNRMLSCNAAFARLQGRTVEEISGMTILDMYAPESLEHVKRSIAMADLLGSFQFEAFMLRSDGSTYPVQMDVVTVRDDSGKILYRVGTQQDILLRRIAEQELQKSERKLKLFVEFAPAAIAMFDKNMNYLAVSMRFAEDYRLTVHDFLGKSHYEIFPEIPERWKEIHRRCLAGALEKAEEDPFPRVDGTLDWIRWEIHPWYEDENVIGGIILFSEVITERKLSSEKILELNADLENRVASRTEQLMEANKELEAFSFSVSHDLRAPLRAIMGFSSILKEEHGRVLDEEGNRLCDVIISSAGKMGRLIDDLLAFSKLAKSEVFPGPVNMGQIVLSAYDELTAGKDKSRIELHLADLPETPADHNMISQVWINLISNAIKYSSKNEKSVIDISCSVEPGQHVYCIRDNGIGFDMRYAGKLFGVFQRLHSNFDYEGTGVGLAIVQRIIQKHGGKIWADGKPGVGASFWFSLPL
jgi:PAS domain S-box-containing protein